MSDIVKRLRSTARVDGVTIPTTDVLHLEAADEIQRLRKIEVAARDAVDQGHNDDCLFCGLKDKRLIDAICPIGSVNDDDLKWARKALNTGGE